MFRALTLHRWWPLGSSTTWNCTGISCSRGMKFSLLQENESGSLSSAFILLPPPTNYCEEEVRPSTAPSEFLCLHNQPQENIPQGASSTVDLVITELWLKALLLEGIYNSYRENINQYSLNNIFQEIHGFLGGKREKNNYSTLS